jgi:hypothetical protein
MRIPRPFFTLFQSRLTAHAMSLQHVLNHRRTTWLLALFVLLDSVITALPALAVFGALLITFGAQSFVPASALCVMIGLVGWNITWIEQNTQLFSPFLLGGAIYVIEDAAGTIGFTTSIDVANHPNVGGVVEAIIPGALLLRTGELRQFKPAYTFAQLHWSEAAVTEAMIRQRTYRMDWD